MSTFNMSSLDELLADEAIWGLDSESEQILDRELSSKQIARDLSWERSAAVLTMALQHKEVPPPSAALMTRLRADAPLLQPKLSAVPRPNYTNMLLAAALLMLAVFVWMDSTVSRNGDMLTAVELRQSLIKQGSAAVWDWSSSDFQGDVVWDASAQRGTMRFVGLPANDPSKRQYQLWIFDARRDAAYPVDGGVFDIPDDGAEGLGAEIVIPITPKILVHEAQAFVVTVEAPGGVVVSGREQVVGQAKPL